ncbi:MAG: alpha/beta hydrolase [Lachnospiraceae bacterium]|nr:alpha/beta hydrolase [Lachnospiraceae bacterium]
MKKYKLTANDQYSLSVHTFDIEHPKAVIQIIHGMEEHQKRYEKFAGFLNENGFAVVSSDLRGHGASAPCLGFFSEKNGDKALIADEVRIRRFIAQKYPDIPVYLFAHSMGTIISRVLLQKHSHNYKKAVLSGYPNFQTGAYFGLFCASVIQTFRGADYKSKFLQNLTVGVFNRGISNPQTEVDWICHNPDTIKAYLNDPYCGIGFTCSAFKDLYHLVIKMHQPESYKNIQKTLPILLLRGTDDPCVGKDKGADDSFQILKTAGFLNITKIDYPNMRHEILNEIDYKKVYCDIAEFYNQS